MANLSRLKELSKKYRRWQLLEEWIARVELVYKSDLQSAISNLNSLLETIFKTILAERVSRYKNDQKLLKDIKLSHLVNQTLSNIKITKCEENSRFITGIMTAIQNLGEIRNSFSHGQNLATHQKKTLKNLQHYFFLPRLKIFHVF